MQTYKSLNYFKSHEACQFSFYRIPKALFTDPRFKRLSTSAKLLYGMLLDRMDLSRKNGWFDEMGRVYIYFTVAEAAEQLGCGPDKAMSLFAELDGKKGVDLIERRKQGLGKPAIIYPKNFITRTGIKTS